MPTYPWFADDTPGSLPSLKVSNPRNSSVSLYSDCHTSAGSAIFDRGKREGSGLELCGVCSCDSFSSSVLCEISGDLSYEHQSSALISALKAPYIVSKLFLMILRDSLSLVTDRYEDERNVDDRARGRPH